MWKRIFIYFLLFIFFPLINIAKLPDEVVFAVRQAGKNNHWYANFGVHSSNPDFWFYGSVGQLCKINLNTKKVTVLYGNLHPGGVFIDAKPIPGTDKIVMVHCPKHGRKEHGGNISILTPNLGPDALEAETMVTSIKQKELRHYEKLYRDPYPLSGNAFLVAKGPELLLMNEKGQTKILYILPDELVKQEAWIHEPRPLVPRTKEPIIPSRVDLKASTGKLFLLDVYNGRNMGGVKRGDIKKLLVLETLPKSGNYSGQPKPLTLSGAFSLERILGVVPVEEDGSAFMELPANRSLHFAALDENDNSVKWMQSFCTVMPGEVSTCIGCHEERGSTPTRSQRNALAFKKPAGKLQPIEGIPEIYDFQRDIQPVLDEYCISCHNTHTSEGKVVLSGDQGPSYTLSYYSLILHFQIADGRNLKLSNYYPREIGSSASYLMKKIDGSHHGVKLRKPESRLLKHWIDSSAHFAGTYAALGSGMVLKEHIDYESINKAKKVIQKRCGSCHEGKKSLPTSAADDLGMKEYTFLEGTEQGRQKVVPPWIKHFPEPWQECKPDGGLRPGTFEWVKVHVGPRWYLNRHRIYNLSHPERSLQLLAPLAKNAGGYDDHPEIFKNKDDSDYQVLLQAIMDTKKAFFSDIKRFHMADFQPTEHYVRHMKEYHVLPPDFKLGDPINVFDIDQKYWESLWYKSAPKD